MDIDIRLETEADYSAIDEVLNDAFEQKDESLLVRRIRNSEFYIPELTFVVTMNSSIVGHIMLSKIFIENENNSFESLALAPVSVLAEHQNKGIGSKLITFAIAKAKEYGYDSIILLGHEKYYPRFGFETTTKWNIKAPFDVPDVNFMALELKENALEGKQGIVQYPDVWELNL